MIFTEALQLYCKKHKISVRRLAKEAGLGHGTAAEFLRGDTKLGEDNFAKLLIWAMSAPLREEAETVEPHFPDGATGQKNNSSK